MESQLKLNMQANRVSNGKYIITPDAFDRKRIVVDGKPSYSDGTNGDSYPIKYSYVTADGKEKLDYIHTVLPTLSVVYGCSQREPEDGKEIKPDAKYGLTLGYRVIQDGTTRKPRAVEDDKGNFLKWEEQPRVFKMQEHATGNAFRGDDKDVAPAHAEAILKYYTMLSEVESEVREQLAAILNKAGKSLTYSEKTALIRCSTKTPYQDIHAKVAQFKDRKDGATRVSLKATTDLEGRNVVSFEEFCAKSGGARVVPWVTVPSAHVSTSNIPTVRCTVDRVLCKALGADPNASRESLAVAPEDIPDFEAFDPALAAPSPKRARLSPEAEAAEAVAGLTEEDVSVFA